jgi:hypothetical protein
MQFKDILIEGTQKTPKISFNGLSGELILSGRSYPENGIKVFEPLMDWIHEYIKSPQKTTNLHLKLEYFNSTTVLYISKMIKSLGKINQKDASLYIHLYFDDEDLDFKDTDELKDIIFSFFDKKEQFITTIGIITHDIDKDGKVRIQSKILI